VGQIESALEGVRIDESEDGEQASTLEEVHSSLQLAESALRGLSAVIATADPVQGLEGATNVGVFNAVKRAIALASTA